MFLRIHRDQTDLQLFHIVFKAHRLLCHGISAGIGPVLCGLLPVLFRDHCPGKIFFINLCHAGRQFLRSCREIGHNHLRQHLPYHFPFRFAVIKKDKGIRSQIQFFRHLTDIVRLRVPVDPAGCEIFRPKQHMGMMFQDLHGILFIIFGCYG